MDLSFLFHFILGGILFTIIHHFAKSKNTVICSIIPAFPTLCIVGLLYLIYYGGNINNYIKNTILTFSTVVLFLVILFLLNQHTNNIQTSLFLSIIIYLCIIIHLVNKKLLV